MSLCYPQPPFLFVTAGRPWQRNDKPDRAMRTHYRCETSSGHRHSRLGPRAVCSYCGSYKWTWMSALRNFTHQRWQTMDYFRYRTSPLMTNFLPKDQQNFETAGKWSVATQQETEADSRHSGCPAYFRGVYHSFRGRYNRMDDILNGFDQSLPT